MSIKSEKKYSLLFLLLTVIIGINQLIPNTVIASSRENIIEFHIIKSANNGEYNEISFGSKETVENATSDFRNSIESVFDGKNLDIPDNIKSFLVEDLSEASIKIVRQIENFENRDYILADDLEEYFNVLYAIQYNLYNNFRNMHDEYILDSNYNDDIAKEILSYYGQYQNSIFSNFINYYTFGNLQYPHIDESFIGDAYDKIYGELSKKEADETILKKQTGEIMEQAVLDWVKETGIDYINAYIAQVNQYLQLAKECGYVYDEEYDDIVNIYSGDISTEYRELLLKDFDNYRLFSLDSAFLKFSMNSEGNEFLTPEEIWNSEEFQLLVDGVISNMDILDSDSKEDIVNKVKATIGMQYMALGHPGSTQQPVTSALPQFISNFLSYFTQVEGGQKLPEISSWLTESGKLPYDIYRKENYIKVPYVKFEEYGVKYNANATNTSGELPIDEAIYSEGDSVIVLSNGDLLREGYIFIDWNTQKDGSGISFKPNDKFIITDNIILYAQWKEVDVPVEPEKPEKEKPTDYSSILWDWGYTTTPTEKLSLHRAYINGYPDGSVKPQGEITRGEVAAIMSRLHADVEEIEYSTDTKYNDVKATDWYAKHIVYVSDKGLMEGYEDGSFKPEEKITRAEYATVVARFKNLGAVATSFEDSKDHWANEFIGAVANKKWITGYPDGSFKPINNISREEVATMTNKMLDRNVDELGVGDLSIKKFTDLIHDTWSYYELVEASNTHEYLRRNSPSIVEDWKKIIK